ncbi:MAG: hypothetical protein ACKVTZ_22430, partial [Bacteroidia bacterium]
MKLIHISVLAVLMAGLLACGDNPSPDNGNKTVETPPTEPTKPAVQKLSPEFNADSAYTYIEKQLSFGHRIPNQPAHKKCAAWMVEKF